MTNAPAERPHQAASRHVRLRMPAACIAVVLLCLAPLCAVADNNADAMQPLATIAAVDLSRYMGTWYEIARYPNSFQKKCVGYTRVDRAEVSDSDWKELTWLLKHEHPDMFEQIWPVLKTRMQNRLRREAEEQRLEEQGIDAAQRVPEPSPAAVKGTIVADGEESAL